MTDLPLIAVTGASGLLGRPFCRILDSHPDYRLRGAALSRAGGALDRVDLRSRTAADSWLSECRPSILVHLAAERRPDAYADDPEAAEELNVGTTRTLAELCAAREIPLLFLSTNYVFDGTAAPYSPDDAPNPLNAYGRSKRLGEECVVGASELNRVLRIPMLFGPSGSLDESPVTLIAAKFLRSEGPVALDVRQTRFPAYTPDVAVAMAGLLPELLHRVLPGPYLHFCPPESAAVTKLEMGRILADLVGADPDRAVADKTSPSGAPRPQNVRLLCPALEQRGLLKFTSFRDAAARTIEDIRRAGGMSGTDLSSTGP